MVPSNKTPEGSVTGDIIRRVHMTLADLRSGGAILEFLKSTEPEFMEEVSRFIQTEISRMRYTLSENQSLYIGSVIGASYIAGFLIAREAAHKMFDNVIPFKSDIKQALTPDQIDKVIDENRSNGKSYKEIAKVIKHMLEGDSKKKKKVKDDKPRGDHLNIGDLD